MYIYIYIYTIGTRYRIRNIGKYYLAPVERAFSSATDDEEPQSLAIVLLARRTGGLYTNFQEIQDIWNNLSLVEILWLFRGYPFVLSRFVEITQY